MKNTRAIMNQLRDANSQEDIKIAIVNNDFSNVHFSIKGPSSTMFENGIYHGLIKLPHEYPYAAPSIQFLSQSGRFTINKDICINGYTAWHNDTWSPAINISAIIRAVQSLFSDLEQHGIGYDFQPNLAEVEKFKAQSKDYECPVCKMRHQELFAKQDK